MRDDEKRMATMRRPRIDIAGLRRDQIVAAAMAVIAEQGIQNLSLSEIEKKVGMSRGQLTYYFRTKEDILVAVFDRLIRMMCERHEGGEPPFDAMTWLDVFRHLLGVVMRQPPEEPAFPALQYTFLSQIGHRADFRERLAGLYEHWRGHGAEHLRQELRDRPAARPVNPRAMSTLMQAILHGLAMQAAADPGAVDPDEMTELCLAVMAAYLWPGRKPAPARRTKKPTKPNGVKR
jgi:AcrR family transcriptional regulator